MTVIPGNTEETSHILCCQSNIIVSDLSDYERNPHPFSRVILQTFCVLSALCLLQLVPLQKIIIILDYGRASKQGEHLKHAGQTLPCTVQVKVQSVHSASPGAQIHIRHKRQLMKRNVRNPLASQSQSVSYQEMYSS